MTTAGEWQDRLGAVWAQEWRRTDRSFADLSWQLDAAIDARAPARGRAADLGCGAGGTSLALARARPALEVIGVDLSADLVAAARARRAAEGIGNARFVTGAVPGALTPFTPLDLAVSRHGVMFFDDPDAGFRGIADALAAGAWIVFSCFRASRENEWYDAATRAIGAPAETAQGYAPGPFAFADPTFVRPLLARAGLQSIDLAPVDFAYRAGAGDDPVADAIAFFTRIGPVARAIAGLDEAARAARLAALDDMLAGRVRGGAIDFAGAAWIVTARRPERSA